MSLRIISGVLGAIFTVAVILFNSKFLLMINFLVALIIGMSMIEIFKAMGIINIKWITLPSLIFSCILPLVGYGVFWESAWWIYTVIMLSVIVFDKSIKLKDISLVYMLAIIITFSLSKIVEIRDYGKEFGSFYVLLALGVAWTSDTGAYFWGVSFGRNKLCPAISPKKTIEGVIGGVFVCIISSIFITFLFDKFVFLHRYEINYFNIFILSATGSVMAALGDLCFSLVKRNCHIKDFGNVIPGHGGILDRFDSVIFVVPYLYTFIQIFPIIQKGVKIF